MFYTCRRNYTMNYKKPYLCDTISILCEGMLSETAQVFIGILGNVCINFISLVRFLFSFFLIFNYHSIYSTHKISGHYYSCTGCSLS